MASKEHHVSREMMRELDRRTIEEWGIPGRVLMENAGRAVLPAILHIMRATKVGRAIVGHMQSNPKGNGSRKHNPQGLNEIEEWKRNLQRADGPVCVVCGPGNNGGDGLVIARALLNIGAHVSLFVLGGPETYPPSSDPGINLTLLERYEQMPIFIQEESQIALLVTALESCDVCVDAIFGTGLTRNVEGIFQSAINAMNASDKPKVSVDIPSGLDANTGEIHGVAVKADVTVTFALAKKGMYLSEGPSFCGRIDVAEMGIPRPLIDHLLLENEDQS